MLLSWVTGGALCRPYVTTGCLEAAHRAGASNGTLSTCVTVTPGVMHENLSIQSRRPPQKPLAGHRHNPLLPRSYGKLLYSSAHCRFKGSLYGNQGFQCLLDSWSAVDEDSMCVCPSRRMSSVQTWRGGVVSLFSCAGARRVKSCRGALTRTQ